ncbi:class I SAM-dependent methyltransferase family protein [Actinomadura barringtoniae]|uniref:Class I SAM-dependent methyltransferase family protein n=1 Tax=Actinomadura barringtoniae TaxID=1427535 RepID=A0A939PLU7_9ACTN|nr:class I SAM-dependent methyltransferase family protein [Actinomadura barringtoniae]MBO2454995.1 class I SAM-dependent methyltransferase family protein [Actinomadura barringtoniae]
MARDWRNWHRKYDEPGSSLALRLETVQQRIREALDRCPAGPVQIVSLCAGEGRDLLPVLRDHPRREDVSARLVELDSQIAAVAAVQAQNGVGGRVQVVVGDAAVTDVYEGAVPADVVMVCGIFGNLNDDAIERTIACLPQLCAPGATVLWTRFEQSPATTSAVCGWFADHAFEEVAVSTADGTRLVVGAHRFAGTPQPLQKGVRMFTFSDDHTSDHWPDRT